MGKFTVQQMKAGFKFNLKAGNGQIIASSGVFHRQDDCMRAIRQVMQFAHAPVEDQTAHAFVIQPFPKFVVSHGARGFIGFCLYDEQGEELAHSKNYTAKRSCLAGIRSIGENAPGAEVIS